METSRPPTTGWRRRARFAAAITLVEAWAILAAGCMGITSGPGRPNADVDRDLANCTQQVRQCTCYCAIRCGDTCVQRLCNDPCSRDGADDTGRPPPDIAPRDTNRWDSGSPADTDDGFPDVGDTTVVRDAGPDGSPLDTTGFDSDAPDTGVPPDTAPPLDGSASDGTAVDP